MKRVICNDRLQMLLFEGVMVEGVDKNAREVILIATVLSFHNLLRIDTQWVSSKRNKFGRTTHTMWSEVHYKLSPTNVHLMKTVRSGFQRVSVL